MSVSLNYDHPTSGVSFFLDFLDTNAYPFEKKRPRNRKFYSVEHEDPAIKVETEGGYVFTRPRYRRYPLRRTWTFGYSDLSDNQMRQLENFWISAQGGSFAFQWFNYDAYWAANSINNGKQTTDPADIAEYTKVVRFVESPKITVMNMGQITRYDVELKVKEV